MRRFGLILLAMTLFLSACSGISDRFEPVDQNLETADDYQELIDLVKAAQANQKNFYGGFGIAETNAALQEADGDMAARDDSLAGAGEYSKTNVQVEGVDEADIIKSDGRYLYVVANQRLLIIDAADPEGMSITAEIAFSDYISEGDKFSGQTPLELYLDSENNRLTLLVSGYTGETYRPEPVPDQPEETKPDSEPGSDGSEETGNSSDGYNPDEDGLTDEEREALAAEAAAADREASVMPDIWYYNQTKQYVSTIVYDISDKAAPELVRRFSQEGYYITSRKIGTAVYIISGNYTYWLMTAEKDADLDPKDVFPATTEGSPDDEWQTLPAGKIAVVPDGDVNNQMTLAALDIVDSDRDADVLSLLGSSGIVYASHNYIYVAAWQLDLDEDENKAPTVSTGLYRFAIDGASITAAGQGSVPGSIINQFAMDEHDGYFRIATTSGDAWGGEGAQSLNHVYVLDQNLQLAGQVNDLASGEQIKSVRFMGEQVFLVTFRTVDPLFVIDLSQPTQPVVLGELKIPGYSTYLHPYAEDLLLGFGYDVDADGDMLYHGGLKVSLFDISDFNQPREQSTIILGGSGSHSELLYNHKSLLFDRERNMIAFPVMLTKEGAGGVTREYSNPVFQGLVILYVDETGQLKVRGQVSHITESDMDKDFFYTDQIQRAATMGSTLFTFSARQIQSHTLDTLSRLGSVELPGFDDYTVYPMEDEGPVQDTEE